MHSIAGKRKIWRSNGTAWACMAPKETGLLNEVAADRKSSGSSEVYRAALSVRFQPDSAQPTRW